MKLKEIWLLFIIPMVCIVPFKIYSHFKPIAFIESQTFLIMAGIILLLVMIFVGFAKTRIRNMDTTKNIMLGIMSLLVSAAFLWCTVAYAIDKARYDAEWQPILMSILSALSCIAFLLISLTFFLGKNMFQKASFFIYCPVIWYVTSLILFLSIYNNTPDIYDATLKSLLALFLIYQTQIFSTSSSSNIIKLLFLFGMPAMVVSFARHLPLVIDAINNYQNMNHAIVAANVLELSLALYTMFILIEATVQSNKVSGNQKIGVHSEN